VIATDIAPEARAAARANAALDSAPAPHVVSEAAPDAWGARFDLVVANILEPVLLALRPALCAALAPGGTLLLSGFLRPQAPALRAAFAELTFGLQAHDGDWALLQLTQARK
jgi:ribosomal protein L11 methyltransferase